MKNQEKEKVEGEVKSQERICIECNKKFSSGKALGGHMSSAHTQKNKGQKNKSCCSKKPMKMKYNSKSVVGYDKFDDEDDEFKMGYKKKKSGNIICPHCDRDFPSDKSLFGHMKSHPDRPYRGMDPPGCNNLNDDDDINHCSSMISHEEFEEEGGRNQENRNFGNNSMMAMGTSEAMAAPLPVVKGWFRKGRRGAVSMVEKSDNNNEIYYDEHLMGIHLLMHFGNSGGSKSNLDDDGREGDDEKMSSAATSLVADGVDVLLTPPGKSEQSSNVEDEEELDQVKNKGKSKVILENGDEKEKDKLSSPSSVGGGATPPPPPPPPTPLNGGENGKGFMCNSCGKIFATHQALGGHKSSHNKFKMSIYNTIDDDDDQSPPYKGKRVYK